MRKKINAVEEMARIGFINKNLNPSEKSNIQIVVYTDDGGNIPHMHIRMKGSPDACIRYDSAEYFSHGKNNGRVSTPVAKQIDDFLRSSDKYTGISQWKVAVSTWNRNNSKMEIPMDSKQPDYTKLNLN